jgi:hypothetical protein
MNSSWLLLQTEAPELADAVRRRFGANLHHVIGTVRPGGSPRLSGTEVDVTDADVRVGMMPSSRKLADVARDPRVELHSAPIETDLADGDVKLSGRLVHLGDTEGTPGSAFSLRIDAASHVRVVGDELELTTWRLGRGRRVVRRR